jgi:hypothetical protein
VLNTCVIIDNGKKIVNEKNSEEIKEKEILKRKLISNKNPPENCLFVLL